MKKKVETKEKLNIKAIETDKNKLILCFSDQILSSNDKYTLILKRDREEQVWKTDTFFADYDAQKITFDIEGLYDQATTSKKYVWIAYLEVESGTKKKKYALVNDAVKIKSAYEKQYYNRLDRVSDTIGEIERNENNCVVFAVFDENSALNIIAVNEKRYLEQLIMGKIVKANIKKDKFNVKIKYPKTKYPFKRLILSFRTKKQSDKEQYDFQIDSIKEKNGYYFISASIDLKTIPFKSMYWDLQFMVDDGKQEVKIDIKNQSRSFMMKFCSLFHDNSYWLDEKTFVFPYVTLVKTISLQCRERGEYDGFTFRLKERIAFARYLLTSWYLKKQQIYLVYEKFCYMAQDNGYYFFKYCMDHDMEKKMGRKIYYIMDKNSPDREVLRPYDDHVIDFMSIKHMTYLLAANLLISTDAKNHAYAWRKRGSILDHLVRRQKLVFLQHGVTAFKRVDFLYGKNRTGGCNLFVVTSDFEKKIVAENFNYKDNEIAVTGFARWDVLNDKSNGSREIILMPTWRNWLEEIGDEQFKKSNYYLNYMKLLNTERLHEVLEQYDLTLNFYLHPKFKEYIGNFIIDAKRIRFIPFGEEPLNELMMKCRMLITDYSSVAWDTFYQCKPVVFYQFDLDEYNETHGSYIDMKTELFGERVEDVEPLINLIEEYAKNDFNLKSEYRAMHEKCFNFIDNDNSKRICEHIMKKGW